MTIQDLEHTHEAHPIPTRAAGRNEAGSQAKPHRAGPGILGRALLVAVAYGLVTLGLLASLLIELREEAIGASRRELSAFAQLTAGHTSEVAFDLEQRLRLAAVTLSVAVTAGMPEQEAMSPMLREVVAGSRALRDIVVLDARGRVVYQANGISEIGANWSQRPIFRRFSSDAAADFSFEEPLHRDGSLIPAALPWRRSSGEFLGAVVGLMDPRYFDAAWAFDSEIDGLSIALVVNGTNLIARLPTVATAAGSRSVSPDTATLLQSKSPSDTLEAESPLTGLVELQAFRRIAAYPGLAVVVAQPMDVVLAGWRQIAWISGSCWALASTALAALGLWLAREMRLREALQQRYHALFNSIPQAVIVSDRETGAVLACNDAAIERYGWAEPARGAGPVFALPAEFAVLRDPALQVSRDVGRLIDGQRHRNAQGEVLDVELNVRLVDVEGRPALLTVAADVSERLRAERDRRAAEEQFRQAQKMDMLGQLTGGIAHDFNNLLMVVADGVEELGDRPDVTDEVRSVLERISGSTRRAEDLTRKMLAFSRKQPLRPRPVNLNDLVTETGSLMRRILGEHVEIDSILSDELWTVELDPALFETSLVNLCLNARDAMPNGGRVLIETGNVTVGRSESSRELLAGDYVLVTVTDTGHGIPPQHLGQIFEPYFTTKSGSQGSGLGLSMVYGFVRQSGGRIVVESEVDRGTVFRIHLPRHIGEAASLRAPESQAIPGGSERVLVVEDDAAVRASVVRQLRSLGYHVSEADGGGAGLRAFEAAATPFDLLLTDVVMPGSLNGKALADAVAARWPGTAILFMSGYSATLLGDADSSLALLAKPFRKADLARQVRRTLEVRRGGAPEPSL